mmetsp:Transcript_170580/g.547155  ORF Transcript_170580/g.547155 Transcript_170580/m.547155 type:complete len:1517 (+) Transcript_170580:545-5095(+)
MLALIDLCIMPCVLAVSSLYPLQHSRYFLTFDALLVGLFAVLVLTRFRTGIVEFPDIVEIKDPELILHYLLSSWNFRFDAIAFLATPLLYLKAPWCVLGVLRLLKCWRLPRDMTRIMLQQGSENGMLAAVGTVLISILVVSHLFGCAWFWSHYSSIAVVSATHHETAVNIVEAIHGGDVAAMMRHYLDSLSNGTFMLCGWWTPDINSDLELFIVLGIAVAAQCFAAYMQGSFVVAVSRASVMEDHYAEQNAKVNAACKTMHLTDTLRKRICRYHSYLTMTHLNCEAQTLFSQLSMNLQSETRVLLMRNIIFSADLFKDLPSRLIFLLVSTCIDQAFSPGDIVVRKGEIGECMYIILRGTVSVLPDDAAEHVVATLHAGDYFGDVCLVLGKSPRTAWIRANTFIITSRLDKQRLDIMLEDSPDMKYVVLKRITMKVDRYARTSMGHGDPLDTLSSASDMSSMCDSSLNSSLPSTLHRVMEDEGEEGASGTMDDELRLATKQLEMERRAARPELERPSASIFKRHRAGAARAREGDAEGKLVASKSPSAASKWKTVCIAAVGKADDEVDETTPLMSARSDSSSGASDRKRKGARRASPAKKPPQADDVDGMGKTPSAKERWGRLKLSVANDSSEDMAVAATKQAVGGLARSMMGVVQAVRMEAKMAKRKSGRSGTLGTAALAASGVSNSAAESLAVAAIGKRFDKLDTNVARFEEKLDKLLGFGRRGQFLEEKASLKSLAEGQERLLEAVRGRPLPAEASASSRPVRGPASSPGSSQASLAPVLERLQEVLDAQRGTHSELGRVARLLKDGPPAPAAERPAGPSLSSSLEPVLERLQEVLEVQGSTRSEIGQLKRKLEGTVTALEEVSALREQFSEIGQVKRKLEGMTTALEGVSEVRESLSEIGQVKRKLEMTTALEVVSALKEQLSEIGQVRRKLEGMTTALEGVSALREQLSEIGQVKRTTEDTAALEEVSALREQLERVHSGFLGLPALERRFAQRVDESAAAMAAASAARPVGDPETEHHMNQISEIRQVVGKLEARLADVDGEVRQLLGASAEAQTRHAGDVQRRLESQLAIVEDVRQAGARMERQLGDLGAGRQEAAGQLEGQLVGLGEVRGALERLEQKVGGLGAIQEVDTKLDAQGEHVTAIRQVTERVEKHLKNDMFGQLSESLGAHVSQIRATLKGFGNIQDVAERFEEQSERIGGLEESARRVERQLAAGQEEVGSTLRQLSQQSRQLPASLNSALGKTFDDFGQGLEEQGKALYELLRRQKEAPQDWEAAGRQIEGRMLEGLQVRQEQASAALKKQLEALSSELAQRDAFLQHDLKGHTEGLVDQLIKAELQAQLISHASALDRSIRARGDELEKFIGACLEDVVFERLKDVLQATLDPPGGDLHRLRQHVRTGGVALPQPLRQDSPPRNVLGGGALWHGEAFVETRSQSPSPLRLQRDGSPTSPVFAGIDLPSETMRRRRELSRRLQELASMGGPGAGLAGGASSLSPSSRLHSPHGHVARSGH